MATPNANDYQYLLAGSDRPFEDVLDDVYRKYADSNPFMPILHFVDHATLGPEALVALNLGNRVPEWVSRHRVRPYNAPVSGININVNWRDALGKATCHGDWLRFFETELSRHSYQQVLQEWIPRFSHEVGAFLFHGLIRSAYAVRALDHKDSLPRRGELARGLSLWAIGVKTPPSDSTDQFRNLRLEFDIKNEILDVARAGAAKFVDSPTVPHLHLVTAPMAYMMVQHLLTPSQHQIALGGFAKTHASAFKHFEELQARADARPVPIIDREGIEVLTERFDPHPLKLTEAALRACQLTGDDLFLKAAGQVQKFPSVKGVIGAFKSGLLFRRSSADVSR